jgi:regulatory protein
VTKNALTVSKGSMVVTKVERQKKHPSRVSIHIDNQYAIGIHKEVLLQSGLRVGDQVSERTIDELKKQEELHKARESSLRLLSHRARSEKELRDRLKQKGLSLESITKVIGSFTQSGLVDDLEFARAFAHDKLLRKPMGRSMLTQQLRQKGISKEIIEQVLSEVYERMKEDEYAVELARNRFERFKSAFDGLEPMKQRKKLSDYLSRRGFAWETVAKAINEVLGEGEP